MRRLPTLVLFALLASARGQEPPGTPPKEEPDRATTVRILSQRPGTRVAEGRGFRLVDHEVFWEVGGAPCATREELREVLERICRDPALRIPDPRRPGQRMLPPVRIEADEHAVWGDVGVVLDECARAGFAEFEWIGGDAPRLVLTPKAVQVERPGPRPPALNCTVPDDAPAGRREIRLLPSGDVSIDGRVVERPDREALVEALAPLREGAAVQKAPGRDPRRSFDGVATPVFVWADEWTPWHRMRALLEACVAEEPVLWRIELATVYPR